MGNSTWDHHGREGDAEVLGEVVAGDAGDDDGRRGRRRLARRRRRHGRDPAVAASTVVLFVRVAVCTGVVRSRRRPDGHGPVQTGTGDAAGDRGSLGERGRAGAAVRDGYGGGSLRCGGGERGRCPENWSVMALFI